MISVIKEGYAGLTLYHGTKSQEHADKIIENGFYTNLQEVNLAETKYNAAGYGKYLVKVELNSSLRIKSLTLDDLDNEGWDKESSYDSEWDGIYYSTPGHASDGNFIIFRRGIPKLNKSKMSFGGYYKY